MKPKMVIKVIAHDKNTAFWVIEPPKEKKEK
jgi:hypothetical protein